MTCSGRRRRNRNALTIVSYVLAFAWQRNRWPYLGAHNDSNVQTLASRLVPQRRIEELREEGVNWSYLAERLNRERAERELRLCEALHAAQQKGYAALHNVQFGRLAVDLDVRS